MARAMSMAAGEYVSVSSQSDTEQADLARERKELHENSESELDELAKKYVERGIDHPLAREVAAQLMAKDALTAHARDELGISEISTARPVQAALTSAATFSLGAAMPLLMVVVSPADFLVPIVFGALGFLALLGTIRARAGGANVLRAIVRMTFWGALAMALTAGVGKFFSAGAEHWSDRRSLRAMNVVGNSGVLTTSSESRSASSPSIFTTAAEKTQAMIMAGAIAWPRVPNFELRPHRRSTFLEFVWRHI